MPGVSVLLDMNILLSGLVFSDGDEHRILRLTKDVETIVVLPEFVREDEKGLADRFTGYEAFLDVVRAKMHVGL